MRQWWYSQSWQGKLLLTFGACLAMGVWLGIALDAYMLWVLPVLVAGGGLLLMDYRWALYSLLFLVPFSAQIEVMPMLNLDVPTEPLLALCMVLAAYQMVTQRATTAVLLRHPLVLLLALQLLWALITAIPGTNISASFKYILQRLWYIGALVLLPVYLLHSLKDARRLFRIIGWGLLLALLPLVTMQTLGGLDWNQVNANVGIFFINHVIYGCIAAMAIPLYITLYRWRRAEGGSGALWLFAAGVAIYATIFSYTRASWLAALLLPILWVCIRFRLFPLALCLALLLSGVLVYWMLDQNRYLGYAPNFKETVMHADLDKHLAATVEGRDLSSMERVYRWVAAKQMIYDNPWMGTGPDTFYPQYFRYSVETYRTYVSDNPEQSTAHNYFMMVATEQGLPGMLLFVVAMVLVLMLAYKQYVSSQNRYARDMLMGILLIQCVFLFHQLMNDLVEENKLSYLFWLLQGVTLWLSVQHRQGKAMVTVDSHSGQG
jgi:O-antigen ligase